MKTMQYTIRGVPSRIDSLLRDRARREHKSLNVVAIEALKRGLGASDEAVQFDDMDDLVGTWVDDPEFDAAIESMDVVDEELWR